MNSETDTELRGNGGIGIASATLLLSHKIQLNLMLEESAISALPADYSFTFKTADGFELATVNAETIGEAKNGYYNVVLSALGLSDFDQTIVCEGNYLYRMEMTVISLADLGVKHYTETEPNATNAQLFRSIADLGRMANGEDAEYGEPVVTDVNWTQSDDQKAKLDGDALEMKTMGLVMTDAIGIRLTGETVAADTALQFIVGGVDVTSNCVVTRSTEADAYAFTVDMYVNVAKMTKELDIKIVAGEEAATFTMTIRVDALAEMIVEDTSNELTEYALAYIQAADTYVKAREV